MVCIMQLPFSFSFKDYQRNIAFSARHSHICINEQLSSEGRRRWWRSCPILRDPINSRSLCRQKDAARRVRSKRVNVLKIIRYERFVFRNSNNFVSSAQSSELRSVTRIYHCAHTVDTAKTMLSSNAFKGSFHRFHFIFKNLSGT